MPLQSKQDSKHEKVTITAARSPDSLDSGLHSWPLEAWRYYYP